LPTGTLSKANSAALRNSVHELYFEHPGNRLSAYSFKATEMMPLRTKKAPRTKREPGISPNNAMPNRVAPMGSRRASVAVSKDLRFERDE